jgi:LytS/YehU family sensor histidine kinase
VVHPDADVLDAQVPHLILQPLVENAIKHGITTRAAVGHVLIGARRINDCLYLTVRDDGSGMPGTAADQGVGLSNTKARLRQLYGDDASIEVVNMTDGGVSAQVVLPYRVAAAEWRGEG